MHDLTDISVRLRTNRVSSLSNRPPTAEPHFTSRAQHLTRDSRKQIRRRTGDRLLAFCRLTRAAPQFVHDRASNVVHCSYPWSSTLPSHTPARSHIQTNTRRAVKSTASSHGSRGHCSPFWLHSGMQCSTPRNETGLQQQDADRAHMSYRYAARRCRPAVRSRKPSGQDRTWHGKGMTLQTRQPCQATCWSFALSW